MFVFTAMVNVFSQNGIPDIPKEQTSLYDYANLLSKQEQKRLEQKLIRYSDSTSTQIVVITMTSIGSNNIAMFATELAQKWGIGQKGKDNGILVLIAKNEHKVNISTGYGVEHLLTDALSRRIIESMITPNFKSGNFYAGLNEGTDAIFQVLNGEFKGERKKNKTGNDSSKMKGFFIVVVIVLFFVFRKRNNKGGGRGGRRSASSDILTAILFSSMGRSSGGFGGGSSGGFGGGGFGGDFGGGGFGGGGASGSW